MAEFYFFIFLLNAQVLNYECKCVHVHNLDLKLSTLFIETTSIGGSSTF